MNKKIIIRYSEDTEDASLEAEDGIQVDVLREILSSILEELETQYPSNSDKTIEAVN